MHRSATKIILLLIIAACSSSLAVHAPQSPKLPAASNGRRTRCLPRERDALLAFKHGIPYDFENKLASWRYDQDCCLWTGVTCSNRTGHGHVVKLDLSASFLAGQISPSLLSLEYLEYLDLSLTALEGLNQTFPEFLGSMKNLRHLDLSSMAFMGRVPPLLGNLTKLEYLDLSYTKFSGNVPPQLGNLSDLRYLDLSSMQDAYSTDVSWLTQLHLLEYLDMSNVNLSTNVDWPLVVNMIPNLKNITLNSCSLLKADQSIAHLNLTRLEKLSLSGNHFGHPVASCWFWNLTSITSLSLVSTYLHGPFPNALGEMVSLKELFFDRNGNAATMTVDLKNLCELEILWLGWSLSSGNITEFVEKMPRCTFSKLVCLSSVGNNMSGMLPHRMGHFTSLSYLDLSKNNISGAIPPEIRNLTSLQHLFISSNRIIGQTPLLPRSLKMMDVSMNFLSGQLPFELGAPNLQSLYMSSNLITGQVPKSIFELQQISFLDLSDNHFEGELPRFSNMPNLVLLKLSRNCLSGNLPTWFKSLSSLVFLDLSRNKLHGTLPTWIGDLVNLRFLHLSHNNFYGDIPMNITSLRGLQYLNLAANNLSGVIPLSLSNLKGMEVRDPPPFDAEGWYDPSFLTNGSSLDILSSVMKHEELEYGVEWIFKVVGIDLSLNHLTGEIPVQITFLTGLLNLNLSSNHLVGPVPDKIRDMKSMESLDLSRNNLSGEIPPNLSDLTYLSYLDLSFNNLTGTIPSGRQLDTLYTENPSMYDGNNGLCGPPLHRNCSVNSTPTNNDHNTSEKDSDPLLYFYLGLGPGYIACLWVVFCTLLFKKTWRIAYFCLSDRLYDKLHVFVAVTWARTTIN